MSIFDDATPDPDPVSPFGVQRPDLTYGAPRPATTGHGADLAETGPLLDPILRPEPPTPAAPDAQVATYAPVEATATLSPPIWVGRTLVIGAGTVPVLPPSMSRVSVTVTNLTPATPVYLSAEPSDDVTGYELSTAAGVVAMTVETSGAVWGYATVPGVRLGILVTSYY